MHAFTLCLSTILFCTAASYEEDFYWKEYRGEIPHDAFPAGKDEIGNETYIGQAYIHRYALAVVQIFPGKREVDAPCYGVKKATKNIKIFCTKHPNKLSWFPTTAESFALDTIGLYPVLGGTDEREPQKGGLNIGMLMYQGILKIGAVAAYDANNAFVYFPHGNVEHRASKFQVLVYNHTIVDVDDSSDKVMPCVKNELV